MAKRLVLTISVLLAATLAGCDSGDDSGPGITFVRGFHAVPDAPNLVAELNAYVVAPSLPYARASQFAIESFEGGRAGRTIRVTPVLPELESTEPVLTREVTLRNGTEASFIFFGSLDAMEFLQVETPRRLRPIRGLYLQFAHVASSVGALDVYATAPDTELTATSPLYTVAPREYTESLEIPVSDLRIRLTPTGTLDVVFDTGTIELEDTTGDFGEEFLMTVFDTLTPGGSPVKLVAGNSFGGSITIADENAPAGLRVVHASQDTPSFDVVVGDNFGSPLATDVAYKDATVMAEAPRGIVNLNFTVPGSSSEFVFEEQVDLTADAQHTLWLIGNNDSLADLTVAADNRSIGTEARIRLANAAPDGDFFSLYLAETATSPPNVADRVFVDVPYGAVTGYSARLPATYQLTLTERFYGPGDNPNAAEENIIVGPVEVTLNGGDVLTFLVLPPDTPGGLETLETYDDAGP